MKHDGHSGDIPPPGRHHGERVVEEAADWFVLMQDPDARDGHREAFADWLGASADHVREYLALAMLHADLGADVRADATAAADARPAPATQRIQALLRIARESGADNVVALAPAARAGSGEPPEPDVATRAEDAAHPQGVRPRRSRRPGFALAASLLLAVAGAAALLHYLPAGPDAATFATRRGEQKSFLLPDDTLVTLNAVSTLKLRYGEQYRDVELLSGEALFEVAKHPRRPFRVLTPAGVVQAIGTRFNVYHRGADTMVTVVEGVVEVRKKVDGRAAPATGGRAQGMAPPSPLRLTRGEQARIDPAATTIAVARVDPETDTAWRQRRLSFDARPLGAVVAQFNLYNETVFEIVDPALNDIRISGAFYANDPRSFVLFLQEARLAEATDAPGRIRLSRSAVSAGAEKN